MELRNEPTQSDLINSRESLLKLESFGWIRYLRSIVKQRVTLVGVADPVLRLNFEFVLTTSEKFVNDDLVHITNY